MARLNRTLAVFTVLLAQVAAQGCGAGTPESGTPAGTARDEERAANLLERARATKDAERYRRLLSRFPDTHAASDGREDLAGLLIDEAERALKGGDYATADDRAEEATRFAGLAQTEKARAVQKRVDEARATRIAKKAEEASSQGKCVSALKLVAAPLREKPRDHFKSSLHDGAEKALEGCLTQRLGDEVKAGNVEAARTLLASPDATTALDKEAWTKVETWLKKAIVQQSMTEIKPLLDQQKWKEAFLKLDEVEKSGKLGTSERPIANEIVRDAIAARVGEWSKEALSAKKPSDIAKKIDESLSAAGYESVPAELAAARAKVAIAVECERQRCSLGKPSFGWAWGAVDVHPPADAAGEGVAKLAHAQKVWVLGKALASFLISTEDPGAAEGSALFEKASGWVTQKNLKTTDTTEWLPPTDQLKGVVVWAPLRAPSKDYHLGTIKKLEGRKVTVERMADKADVVVDSASLRIGSLAKGLKVMAFCVDQIHPEQAKVDSVVSAEGVPRVKIVCDKGDVTRVEIGSALVTRAEWLPPRKP